MTLVNKNFKQQVKGLGLFACLAMLGACGQQNSNLPLTNNAGNIVGGTAVAEGQFPSVVALVKNNRRMCTGNLIASNKIVTAAHCVSKFDYNSDAEIEDMIGRVIDLVIEAMPEKSLEEFMALSKEDQSRLFRAKTREVIEHDTQDIKLYFGQGEAKVGAHVPDARDIVARVTMPEAAMEHAVALVLKNTIFKTAADESNQYHEKFDIAYLTLKNQVTDITPVPLINPDEHQETVEIGGDVRLVGFGLKMDPRLVEGSAARVAQLEQAIKKETDPAKKAQLTAELNNEQLQFLTMYLEYAASGNKNTVLMRLEDYDHETVVLKRKAGKLQGACFGDSGGPAFVTTPDGQLRQLGVIVTVDYCGNKTMVSPLFDRQ